MTAHYIRGAHISNKIKILRNMAKKIKEISIKYYEE